MSVEHTDTPEQTAAYIALGKLAAEFIPELESWASNHYANLRNTYPSATAAAIRDEQALVTAFKRRLQVATDALLDATDAVAKQPGQA
jgi:hypothetical protein